VSVVGIVSRRFGGDEAAPLEAAANVPTLDSLVDEIRPPTQR
jgi:hypothetical protein